jgi:3-hydroxyisobutyrate dehydrogenase-like beta-hydroxyacid dehydrogenase
MAQRISVLGLGNMGAALARTVLSLSGRVTVWNRTPAKAATLVAAGATLAASAVEAVATSDVCVVCVGNYDQTNHMLRPCADLSGKTLLQLSTGTPEEAAALETWAHAKGARYLDGVILDYPSGIGGAGTMIVYAGDRDAWDACEPTLMQLAGASRYVGANLAAPVLLESAVTGSSLMAVIWLIHSAHALERAGVNVGLISELLADCGPLFVKALKSQVDAIARNRFDRPEAMLSTWAVGVDHFPDGPDPDIDLIRPLKSLLHRALAAGYGEEELAAVIKVLRAQTP